MGNHLGPNYNLFPGVYFPFVLVAMTLWIWLMPGRSPLTAFGRGKGEAFPAGGFPS